MQEKLHIKLKTKKRGRKHKKLIKPIKKQIASMTPDTIKKTSPRVLLENKIKKTENLILNGNQEMAKTVASPKNNIDISSPERKRRKNLVEKLSSDLSPKYIEFSNSSGRRNRSPKQDDHNNDFITPNITCFVRGTPPKLKQITPPGKTNEHKFVSYESPIEKLIQKNKILANMTNNNVQQINFNEIRFNESIKNDETKEQIDKENNLIENVNKILDEKNNDLVLLSQINLLQTPKINQNFNNNNKLDFNYELDRDDLPLASFLKSPSSLSTDSAKGSSIDMEIEFSTCVGEIFWGRIASFPYWPCIVWPDPDGRTISINAYKMQKTHIKIHVKFFADNGRRAWLRKAHMIPYNGLEDYEKRSNEILNKYGKRSNLYRTFVTTEKKREIWLKAISEAETILKVSTEQRISKFDEMLEETRELVFIEKRKRRQSVYENRSTAAFYSPLVERRNSLSETPTTSILNTYSINKRERSPSQLNDNDDDDSDDEKLDIKKRKIDLKNANINNNSPIELDQIDENIFNDVEFKIFYDLVKNYILLSKNEILEKYFDINLRKLWSIRNKSIKELKNTENTPLNGNLMTIRRLSNRVKKLTPKFSNINFPENNNTPTRNNIKIETIDKEKIERQKKIKTIKEVVEDIMDLNRNYLFRGLNREPVCKICHKPTNLIKCSGACQSWLHLECSIPKPDRINSKQKSITQHITGDTIDMKSSNETIDNLLCLDCSSGYDPKCFVCNNNDIDLGDCIKCHINWCGKSFHIKCLKYWPQSKLTKSSDKIARLLCPGHICHTCISDDPRSKFLQIDKMKLIKCIECPSTYHSDSFCIPAGTIFLTATQIICPRHRKDIKKKLNLNANWCFICATGGSLICCDTCPTSFHLECLKIQQPEGNYICEECETGRLPLYGELVWAKLGVFRWWPAIILPPPEVPMNLQHKKHGVHDFCIRFFGSNDHTWISRNRVFLYQEGDSGRVVRSREIDRLYTTGIEEAREIYELIKAKKLLQNHLKDKRLTPLPYIKIKTNRLVPPVKIQEIDISELTPCDCNPNDENACGPYSECLNRILLTECNPKICPAGEKCQNQLFEKRIYPPIKLHRTSSKGWGLVAEQDMSTGTFIIEYVGEIIDDAEFKRRIAQKQEEKDENYYFLTLEKDYMIDAGPKGNLARFINHSCDPNCETQKWTVNGVTRVGLFTIKDVSANTELTFNYNLECIGDDKKICCCGSSKCSGFIGVKYKEPPEIPTNPTLKKLKIKARRKSISNKIN